MFNRLRGFFRDTVTEFRRVSWPTRQATTQFTVIVMVITLVFVVYLGVVDLGLSETVKHIIRG